MRALLPGYRRPEGSGGDPPDIALHHAIQEFALELSRSLDSQVLLFGKFHLLAV
jgi:hypothetical protein